MKHNVSSTKSQAIFIKNNVWLLSCDFIRRSPVGITCFTCKIKLSKFAVIEYFFSFWIVIGLDCQSVLKSGFGFGLTITYLQWIWIGLTIQKIGLSNSLHLADCKLSQFMKQQKFHFVNKHPRVTNFFGRKATDGISCVP
jgi:hypothetical protein